jgi:dTDP-4-dehydrorhamnose 3,5-epimerase-like enzyme
MKIAGDEKRQVMLRTPRGIAHGFKVSCMVSALLVACNHNANQWK